MTVESAIRSRRSIRRFLPDPIPVTEIREMLALAGMAPSISNRQMWRFLVLLQDNFRQMLSGLMERRLAELATWPEFAGESQRLRAMRDHTQHFSQAPAVIIVINQGYNSTLERMLVERGMKAWEAERLFSYPDIQSVSAAIAYFTLVAQERGYGTCWMTDVLLVKRDFHASLNLGMDEEIMAAVALGRPADHPRLRERKAIDELIEWR